MSPSAVQRASPPGAGFSSASGVQVIADMSSCYALAALLASTIEQTAATQNVGPLKVGYAITAFGFLFFFGPLSVVTNAEAAIDDQKHRIVRVGRCILGGLLLLAWSYLVTIMVLLMFKQDVFCPNAAGWSWTFRDDPCHGHGTCYAAAQCHCSRGFGPGSSSMTVGSVTRLETSAMRNVLRAVMSRIAISMGQAAASSVIVATAMGMNVSAMKVTVEACATYERCGLSGSAVVIVS